MDLIRQFGTVELSLGLAILITPVLPKAVLMLLDLMVVRALIIIGALWAISSGPLIGLLAFVLIGLLFMERNRFKIIAAQNRFAQLVEADTPAQMTVEEESEPQKTVPVRDFDTPKDRIMYYMPREGCAVNSNEFEPVSGATSLNDKEVFPSQPQGQKAGSFYDGLGFGHIRGVSMAE
jgi:hypothetical protein